MIRDGSAPGSPRSDDRRHGHRRAIQPPARALALERRDQDARGAERRVRGEELRRHDPAADVPARRCPSRPGGSATCSRPSPSSSPCRWCSAGARSGCPSAGSAASSARRPPTGPSRSWSAASGSSSGSPGRAAHGSSIRGGCCGSWGCSSWRSPSPPPLAPPFSGLDTLPRPGRRRHRARDHPRGHRRARDRHRHRHGRRHPDPHDRRGHRPDPPAPRLRIGPPAHTSPTSSAIRCLAAAMRDRTVPIETSWHGCDLLVGEALNVSTAASPGAGGAAAEPPP